MTVITAESINPLFLPSLPLEWRKALPECPGIYFAIDATETIQYIGKSTNIRLRWAQHHRNKHLEQIGDIRLAWLEVSDESLLSAIENALIYFFNPPLNGSSVNGETQMNFRISAEKKDAFLRKARENGTSASHLLLEFIDRYLGNESREDEITNIKHRIAELESFKEYAEKILDKLTCQQVYI